MALRTDKEAIARGQLAKDAAADRVARRRKQCRMSQRRYRDKKNSIEYNLRLDVNELRGNVERLKEMSALVSTRMRNDRLLQTSSVLKAVEQYFAVFCQGLHDPEAGTHVRKCYEVQVSFLYAFMAPDVDVGGRRGIREVLEQWWRTTNYHSSVCVTIDSADVFGSNDAPIVKAFSHLRVGLDLTTIEMVFPHLCPNAELVRLLDGQVVTYSICTEFIFDEKLQVVQLTQSVDYLAGLSAVLPSAVCAAHVLHGALISEQGLLGPSLAPDGVDDERELDMSETMSSSDPSPMPSPSDVMYIEL